MSKAYPSLELRLSTVLFWDVLGWSAHSTGPDAHTHLTKLHAALEEATKATETRDSNVIRHVSWLTDNLVIGLPVDPPTMEGIRDFEGPLGHIQLDAAYLCLYLLDGGYLSRGFVSIGAHYQDDNFAYGTALVEAVEGEEATKYPRVALSEDVAELTEAYARAYYGDPEGSPQNKTLSREGEVVFVDYLTSWLTDEDDLRFAEKKMRHLASVIEAAYMAAHDSKVAEKWKWTADYFNDVAERFGFLDRVDAGSAVHIFGRFIA